MHVRQKITKAVEMEREGICCLNVAISHTAELRIHIIFT